MDHGGPRDASTQTSTPAAKAPSHAERCRTLIAGVRAGTLCTIARDPEGYPFGSLVTVAFDAQGCPLLLLSKLAEHTQNLMHRPDASMLIHEPLGAQPLAAGRVTLLGPCKRVSDDEQAAVRATFLAAHPDASYYVGFDDFGFYRLDVTALRYVGGFGRMSWVSPDDYRAAEPDPLPPHAAGILAHMNDDHADACLAYAKALASIPSATAATMTAVDRYGFELAATTPEGPKAARVAFDVPVVSSEDVRKAMVVLVKRARSAS